MHDLIKLTKSPDERVALAAIVNLLDRAWGKPKQFDPREETAAGARFDFSKLSDDQLQVLMTMLGSVLQQRQGGTE